MYRYGTSPDEIASDVHRQAQESPESVSVADAWARPADVGDTGAVYLRIENARSESDRLSAVSSPIATAEVHESKLEGSIMRMRALDGVEIPAEGDVRLQVQVPVQTASPAD